MLINFRFSNFRSFRDEADFTTIASREKQHSDHIITIEKGDIRLLPVAAIYGGNGSGKTGFIEAIGFARSLVLQTGVSPNQRITTEPFRMEREYLEKPSCFTFEIAIKEKLYRYAFSVTQERVESEQLEEIKPETLASTVIFSRNWVKKGIRWNLEYFKEKQPRDLQFIEFKTRDTLPNKLFLSELHGKDIKIFNEIGKWFAKNLILISPDSMINDLGHRVTSSIFKDYCSQKLREIQTGVDTIEGEKIELKSVALPQEIISDITKDLTSENQKIEVNFDGRRYLFSLTDKGIQVARLVTYHKNSKGEKIRFEISEESQGTRRLIELLPAFQSLASSNCGAVFIIDELDRSLHTLVTRKLLHDFLKSRTASSQSQLIFTTHDGLLLDQSIFRRDEFWFIGKDSDGRSMLTALSDFKGVRNDKDIRKSYLSGRFGGVPIIDDL